MEGIGKGLRSTVDLQRLPLLMMIHFLTNTNYQLASNEAGKCDSRFGDTLTLELGTGKK